MTVRWSAEFHCDTCNATITYEDEAPKIYSDRQALIENNRALRWLEEHRYDPATVEHPLKVVHYNNPFNMGTGWQAVISQTKYILCNVCGSRVYFA